MNKNPGRPSLSLYNREDPFTTERRAAFTTRHVILLLPANHLRLLFFFLFFVDFFPSVFLLFLEVEDAETVFFLAVVL